MSRTPNETIPTQMRLAAEDLGRLDWLATHMEGKMGLPLSRTDAARVAIREVYAARGGPARVPTPRKKIPKKSSKSD